MSKDIKSPSMQCGYMPELEYSNNQIGYPVATLESNCASSVDPVSAVTDDWPP